jgi:high-affinity iron transporter
LKVIFNFKDHPMPPTLRPLWFASWLVLGSSTAEIASGAEPPPAAGEDARRLCAILDYVAGDYGGAVASGTISDAGEYAEQVGFLTDAATLARRLPPTAFDAPTGVGALLDEVHAVAPAERVAFDARALRHAIVEAYGVTVSPAAPPRLEEGRALYAEHCAACHGAAGGADTEAARALQPPPRNFLDDGVMSQLTPTRAFNALTDGVAGTAMPAFPTLSAAERWDLAFYVFGLRFTKDDVGDSAPTIDASVAHLADATEQELLSSVGDPGSRRQTAARLRLIAPYEGTTGSLDVARSGVGSGMEAWHRGDFDEARRRIGEAYLGGFEPHEAALRAADPDLLVEIESAFLVLRDDTTSGGRADADAERLLALLDRAEVTISGGTGAVGAFVGALLVVLREGIEAALLILLVLGLDRRRNGNVRAIAVHAGWVGALFAGAITWWVSDRLIAFAGASREWMEGVVALVAAVAMVTASHWMLARVDSRRRVNAVVGRFGAGPVGVGTLALVSFGAVYREAFEVVLFLKAIALDSGDRPVPMLAGAAAAVVLLVGFVAVALRLGRRLKPAPLLTGAGMMLCVMAVVFVGKGVRALQEAGAIGIHVIPGPRIDLLGVFPTRETWLSQVFLVLALLLSALPWEKLLRKQTLSPDRGVQ